MQAQVEGKKDAIHIRGCYLCFSPGKSSLKWPLGLRKLSSLEKVEILQIGLILRIA